MGNEVITAFLPLMGPDSFAVYAYLKCKEFINRALRHSVRELAASINRSVSTVSRSLEILEYLKLVRITHYGGNKESECELLNSKSAALNLGAVYSRASVSFFLQEHVRNRLGDEIDALRSRQQGKTPPLKKSDHFDPCGNHALSVSHRDTSVSPEKHQRVTRETQTNFYLLQEERRMENVLTPTPSQDGESQEANGSSDEDEANDLQWARVEFSGVMNDLGDHLFNTSRPPALNLSNGAADWEEFCFRSLAVCGAAWHGRVLALTLFVSNPEAAQRGLEKYKRIWRRSLRKWFECDVIVDLVPANTRHIGQAERQSTRAQGGRGHNPADLRP